MGQPDLVCVQCLLLALWLPSSTSLRIGSMMVPGPIPNGSVSDVVLDCDYSLDPGESSAGLVVKWFLNTDPHPVYQWILNHVPQDLGPLKGRLNLSYRATDEPATRHRALNIINPTIDLSGEYRCQVSSFEGEATKSKKMIIYVPEESLELTQSKPNEQGQVRLSCEADGVFPRPELVFLDKASDKEIQGTQVRVIDRKDGLFDIEADVVVDDDDLDGETQHTFGCKLSIPEANYSLYAWEDYNIGGVTETASASAAPTAASPHPVPVPQGSLSADGKETERNNHVNLLLAQRELLCMDNSSANASIKFSSYRQRHQYKLKCRHSAAVRCALQLSLLLAALGLGLGLGRL